MRETWSRWLGILLALTLLAAACGSDGGGDDTAADDAVTGSADQGERCDATVPGTQINYGVYAPEASMDPPYSFGALVGGTKLVAVYDALMGFNFETGEYEPKLAKSLEPNDDFTKWTLTLRDGITYSDGTPMTAQLVSDNIDRFFAEGVRNGSAGYMTSIIEKTALDDVTLEITLDAPWATLPFMFSDEPGMIVNLNAIGDDPEAFGLEPPEAAGVGPYVVERNVPGEEMVLKARSDYWDGPVCVETLRFVFVPGAQATYEAFRAGQIDVGYLRDPVAIADARDARDAGDDGFFVQQDAGAVIMFNFSDGRPTADPLVREAIVLALDEDVINQRAYGGRLAVGRSLILEGSPFYSDDIVAFDKDADEAKVALDKAKASGYDGKLELVCANSAPTPEVTLAAEGLLEAVGFDVEVRSVPTAEQIVAVNKKNYDATCWGLTLGPASGPTAAARSFKSASTGNRQGYANPAMDKALDDLLAADGAKQLKRTMAEVNRIVVDDKVVFSYGATEEGVLWSDKIKGIVPTQAPMFFFDKAYIDD